MLCVRANQHLWLLPGLIHAYKCHARRNLLLFFPDNRLAALRHGQLEPLHLAKSSAPLHQLPRLALFTASRPSLSLFSALRVVSVPSHTCISLWLCPRQSIKRRRLDRRKPFRFQLLSLSYHTLAARIRCCDAYLATAPPSAAGTSNDDIAKLPDQLNGPVGAHEQ